MLIPHKVLLLVVAVISLYFIADFVTSFQAAMDLRDILVKAEQAKPVSYTHLDVYKRQMLYSIAVEACESLVD